MELADRYIYKVYEEKSFSKGAKALYLSQPALSAMVAKQEAKLGFRIFDRTRTPLTLTEKGQLYIEHLTNILESESNLHRRIHALSNSFCGSLTVGGSCQAAYLLLPAVLEAFFSKYPDTMVTLNMGNVGTVDNLFEKLKQGELDLLLSYDNNSALFSACEVIRERLVFAAHRALAEKNGVLHLAVTGEELLQGKNLAEREIEDTFTLAKLPFLSIGKNSNTAKKMAALLPYHENFFPCYVRNARNMMIPHELMRRGVAAAIVSDTHVRHSLIRDREIVYFIPKNEESFRPLYLLHRKEDEHRLLIQHFIALTIEKAKSNDEYINLQ